MTCAIRPNFQPVARKRARYCTNNSRVFQVCLHRSCRLSLLQRITCVLLGCPVLWILTAWGRAVRFEGKKSGDKVEGGRRWLLEAFFLLCCEWFVANALLRYCWSCWHHTLQYTHINVDTLHVYYFTKLKLHVLSDVGCQIYWSLVF